MRVSIYLVLSLSVFSLLSQAAELPIDNSATFKHLSDQGKILWPAGGFNHFTQSHRQKVGEIDVADLDKKRPVNVPLNGLRATSKVILLIHDRDKNRGIADFFSRESGDYQGPQLALSTGNQKKLIPSFIDTYIVSNSRKPLGRKNIIKVGGSHVGILVFSLPKELANDAIINPTLLLNITNRQYGASKLSVSQLLYTPPEPSVENSGIASRYRLDQNITQDSSVYFADDFDDQSWFTKLKRKAGIEQSPWDNTGEQQFVDHQSVHHYSKKAGKTLLIPFRTSSNLAANLDYYFAKHTGSEPQEAYFRYYSMLDSGAWASGGGKLPGFGGTYNRAGWGGRANNGENGWSARGAFFKTIPPSNPNLGGRMPIGSYIYEADTKQKYGQTFAWGDVRSTMQPGKWYCIEQHLKLNTPGKSDGILEVWIDGVKIYHRQNLNFRSTDKLKIEKIWMNYYFGGVAKPQKNFNMYLDNVVIASSYIGPMRTQN